MSSHLGAALKMCFHYCTLEWEIYNKVFTVKQIIHVSQLKTKCHQLCVQCITVYPVHCTHCRTLLRTLYNISYTVHVYISCNISIPYTAVYGELTRCILYYTCVHYLPAGHRKNVCVSIFFRSKPKLTQKDALQSRSRKITVL